MMESLEGAGPIVTLVIAGVMTALSYGDSNRRNKRAAEDIAKLEGETKASIADLKNDHAAQLADVRARNEALAARLNDHQLVVEREYPRKTDLAAMENRLVAKVEEIKTDFGRKNIGHEVKNAVANALAEHILAAKGKLP